MPRLNRISAVLVVLAVASLTCHAGPIKQRGRLRGAVVGSLDELGRTARNMVTFRDKQAALQQWGIVLANSLDAYTTARVLSACTDCIEANPIYGKHPSSLRSIGIRVGLLTYILAGQQYIHENLDHTSWRGVTWLVPAESAGLETWAVVHNLHVLHSLPSTQTVQPGTLSASH